MFLTHTSRLRNCVLREAIFIRPKMFSIYTPTEHLNLFLLLILGKLTISFHNKMDLTLLIWNVDSDTVWFLLWRISGKLFSIYFYSQPTLIGDSVHRRCHNMSKHRNDRHSPVNRRLTKRALIGDIYMLSRRPVILMVW